jgi:hypothetical protein
MQRIIGKCIYLNVSCIADSCAALAVPPPFRSAAAVLPWLPQLIRLGAGEEEWLLPPLFPPPSPRPGGEPGRGGGAGGFAPLLPPPPPPCCRYQGLRNMAASSGLLLHLGCGQLPEKFNSFKSSRKFWNGKPCKQNSGTESLVSWLGPTKQIKPVSGSSAGPDSGSRQPTESYAVVHLVSVWWGGSVFFSTRSWVKNIN